ncbi:MAG: DUF1003 domain-containing protein [Deltaproteobacteria bacterium]|nr:DUF1003 domain-containing protein [Deltaproteobacteria bacterium]
MEGSVPGIECQVCRRRFKVGEVIKAKLVEEPLVQLIREKHPKWSAKGFICLADLNLFRTRYVTEVLKSASQEVGDLEKGVAESLEEEQVTSRNINIEFEANLTLGERLADRLADFGGSWTFISLFMAILFIWLGINTWILLEKPFDPYPYILLNLVLSCLAAIQAPVILMSQNRQEARDRLRAEHDYEINLKAEIEIRKLHEKLDHLLMHQWQRLMDIQQLQVDLMEEISQSSVKGEKAE